MLIMIGNGFSGIIRFFYVDVFPIIEVGPAQAFAVIKATTDSEDLEAITDILFDALIRTDTWEMEGKKHLVLGKITMAHDLIHVRYASGDRPRRVCDVRGQALYVEVDAFGACAGGIGDDIAGVWRAKPSGLDGGGLFRDGRVDWRVFEADLEGNWEEKDEEKARKRRRTDCWHGLDSGHWQSPRARSSGGQCGGRRGWEARCWRQQPRAWSLCCGGEQGESRRRARRRQPAAAPVSA